MADATGDIVLNSKGYYLVKDKDKRPVVQRNIIAPFGDVFSPDGIQRQENISSYTAKIYPNSAHGFGRNRTASDSAHVVEEYMRFFDADAETRFVNDRRLPILEENSTEGANAAVIRASTHHKGNLWVIWEDDTAAVNLDAWRYVGSTNTWTAGAEVAGAVNDIVGFDIISHKTHMIVLFGGNTDLITARALDGNAGWDETATLPLQLNYFSDNLTDHENIDGGLLAEIGGAVVAVLWHESNGTITFESSINVGDNWTDQAIDIASGNGPQGVVVLSGPDRLDKIIVGTAEGLWEVDVSAGDTNWTTRLIHPMVPDNNNCRRMTIHSDGSLWFAQGVSDDAPAAVFRMFVDANGYHVEPVPNSLHLHDGVPDEMLGPIRWMKSSQGFMYASIGGGKAGRNARIICHNGKGWHSMRRHGTENEKIQWIDVSADDDGVERLHYSIRTGDAVSNTKFLGNPNTNPASGVNIKRESSGYIDLPYLDGGMPLVPSNYLQIGINAVDLSSDNTGEWIDLKYGKDASGGGLEARTTNTDLADIVSGTRKVRFGSSAGLASVNLGVRVILNNDSGGSNLDTPKLKDVEIDYQKKVPTLSSFDFIIDIEKTAQQHNTDLEAIIADLETARDADLLMTLSYGQLGVKYVDVDVRFEESLREVGGAGASSAPNAFAQRFGRAIVSCKEVLN